MPEVANPLVTAVQAAAFDELNHTIQLYRAAQDLEHALHLMEPDSMMRIITNAASALSELAANVAETGFNEEALKITDQQTLMALRPTMTMLSQLRSLLLGDAALINQSFSHYSLIYGGFFQRVQALQQQSYSNSQNAGGLGALAGSVFGPVGTVLGALIGGQIAEGMANDEIEKQAQNLCAEFGRLVEATNAFIEQMAGRTLNFVEQYAAELYGAVNRATSQIGDSQKAISAATPAVGM